MFAYVRARHGTRTAVAVCLGSFWALVFAAVRGGGRPRLANALRHFAWSAWLTTTYDADLARGIGEKHEAHSTQRLDSLADTRNNAAGRAYAAHGEAVAGPTPVALWRWVGAGIPEWRAGRLWMVEDGTVVPSRDVRAGRRASRS